MELVQYSIYSRIEFGRNKDPETEAAKWNSAAQLT